MKLLFIKKNLAKKPTKMTEYFSFKREIFRKLFHLLILIFPTILYFLGKENSLKIILPLAISMLAIDYFRKKNAVIKFYFEKFFGIILRPHELQENNFCGATWMLLAVSIVFAICKTEIAFTSFVILAICDATASIAGKSFPSKPFFEKSFLGSASFYTSGIIVIFFCAHLFDSKAWFYLFGFVSLFFTTLIEARPSLFKVDDNFSVPVSFALAMTMFSLMWG